MQGSNRLHVYPNFGEGTMSGHFRSGGQGSTNRSSHSSPSWLEIAEKVRIRVPRTTSPNAHHFPALVRLQTFVRK